MYVHELMTPAPAVCTTSDHLSRAAQIMWDRDCGVVPVLDAAGQLAGVVTDRDLCMAAYTQGLALHELPVERVMSRVLTTIGPDDTIQDALEALAEAEVRRLPVVDAMGRLVGILSLADFVRAAQRTTARRQPKAEMLVEVLATVTRPRPVSNVAPMPKAGQRELASKVIVPAARKSRSKSRASRTSAPKATASSKPARKK
jgi:CBS-domain-containing membrane protein